MPPELTRADVIENRLLILQFDRPITLQLQKSIDISDFKVELISRDGDPVTVEVEGAEIDHLPTRYLQLSFEITE